MSVRALQSAHREWVEEALGQGPMKRDERWSESLAVGNEAFVERMKRELGTRARHRVVEGSAEGFVLRQLPIPYTGDSRGENAALRVRNPVHWRKNIALQVLNVVRPITYFREDFPEPSATDASDYTVARQRDAGLEMTREAVRFTRVRPGESLIRGGVQA